MAEELSRKRRQRGGHRSSATRIISSAIEVLATGDVSQFAKHAVKLNQERASLQQKQTTLRQLDAEILVLVGEDEIEAEIERADLVEENIQLAIANIDNALSSNANANTVVSNQSAQSPVQPSTSANTSTEEGHGENLFIALSDFDRAAETVLTEFLFYPSCLQLVEIFHWKVQSLRVTWRTKNGDGSWVSTLYYTKVIYKTVGRVFCYPFVRGA